MAKVRIEGNKYYYNCRDCGRELCYESDERPDKLVLCFQCGKRFYMEFNKRIDKLPELQWK